MLFLKAWGRRGQSWKRAVADCSSASPKCGYRKSKREMYPSFRGRIKSPKGPLVKGRPPQAPSQRQQAKQFMRLGALKPGLLRSGRDLSSLPT